MIEIVSKRAGEPDLRLVLPIGINFANFRNPTYGSRWEKLKSIKITIKMREFAGWEVWLAPASSQNWRSPGCLC